MGARVEHAVAPRGLGTSVDVSDSPRRIFRMLSIALALYAAGSFTAAVSAAAGYAETQLPFGDPRDSALQLVTGWAFYGAFVIFYGSLLALLAGSADLFHTRENATEPERRAFGVYLRETLIALGAGSGGVLVLATGLVSCSGCRGAEKNLVVIAGLLLTGLSALLLIAAILRVALRYRRGRAAVPATAGALLGVIGVIGDVVSMSLFITGEWTRFGWIAFGGIPLVNWNTLWGSIVAMGSGLLAWSYRRIAMQNGSVPA